MSISLIRKNCAAITVHKFRMHFWTYDEVHKSLCIRNRRLAFLRELSTMFLIENANPGKIDYKIGGFCVCKAFYFQATGTSKRSIFKPT